MKVTSVKKSKVFYLWIEFKNENVKHNLAKVYNKTLTMLMFHL